MDIPNKPWMYLKNNRLLLNLLPIAIQEQLIRQKKIIGIRKPSNEKLYSQLMKLYIKQILFNKNPKTKALFLSKLKSNASLHLISSSPQQLSSENFFISSLVQSFNNIEQVLTYIYLENNDSSFDLLSRQFILNELNSKEIRFKEAYMNWVLDFNRDIEGELFAILANALDCQIVEHTFLLGLKDTKHGDCKDSKLLIQFFRSADQFYFLLDIETMENLEFEFESNRIYNTNT